MPRLKIKSDLLESKIQIGPTVPRVGSGESSIFGQLIRETKFAFPDDVYARYAVRLYRHSSPGGGEAYMFRFCWLLRENMDIFIRLRNPIEAQPGGDKKAAEIRAFDVYDCVASDVMVNVKDPQAFDPNLDRSIALYLLSEVLPARLIRAVE